MRWLLIKDLQILRRSPLLATVLAVYPVAIALMIGFALSSPPAKPTVAIYGGVPPARAVFRIGSQQIDISGYAKLLYESVRAIRVSSPAAAVAEVQNGHALAALIIPADLLDQIESLITRAPVPRPCRSCSTTATRSSASSSRRRCSRGSTRSSRRSPSASSASPSTTSARC